MEVSRVVILTIIFSIGVAEGEAKQVVQSSTNIVPPLPPGYVLDALPPPPLNLSNLQSSAERGDAAAQAALGRQYFTGDSVPVDYTNAFRWSTKAAE